MVQFLYVGIGGFIGCGIRYLITRLIGETLPTFPLATLLANAIAALLIGLAIGMDSNVLDLPENIRLFFIVGLLGGLSTFSTFSAETWALIGEKKYLVAGGNVLLNVVVCLGFVALGIALVKWVVVKGN
jgi:CrcB protein